MHTQHKEFLIPAKQFFVDSFKKYLFEKAYFVPLFFAI